MYSQTLSRRTLQFVNIAHALDHYVLLIFPTAVIAIAADRGLSYSALIGLATGAFVAFGFFSLPVGWLADRFGRRNMLLIYFIGYGLSCLLTAMASTPTSFAISLFVLGIFSAIYHPIGSAMLVTHASKLGRDLGINGVWGNLGAAFASAITAFLASHFGWQTAFVVPGMVCLVAGIAFYFAVEGDGVANPASAAARKVLPVSRPVLLLIVFALAVVAGGMTFNMTTIGLPKLIEERFSGGLTLTQTGALTTAIFLFGALTQLLMGQLVDRFSLPTIFVGLAIFQPIGLAIAATSTGVLMLAGLSITMAAVFGQVVVNDAMVARYVPAQFRARAYSLRYFLGFTTSGLAVPLIAFLHKSQGFGLVLIVAGLFGLAIFTCSLAFYAASNMRSASQPAE